MILFLLGPTAVGKSETAIELALKIRGEIVSADSMQVYRGMNIGTAKPTLDERRGIPHHLFDILDIHELCDASKFCGRARAAISEIQARGNLPIIVGGSGLYVRALSQGLFEGPGRDEKLRMELETLTNSDLHQKLLETDLKAAARINLNDRKRMIRALEVFAMTGQSISASQTQWHQENSSSSIGSFLGSKERFFILNRPREELYHRCDLRVDKMFDQGFTEEVKMLMEQGLANSPTASKAMGYRDVMDYLEGKLTYDEAVNSVKKRTRNFVKRQLTWFRREPKGQWLNFLENEASPTIASAILKQLQL